MARPTTNQVGLEQEAAEPLLCYDRLDWEKRLLCPSGVFSQPGPVLPMILAIGAAVGFYAILIPLEETWFARSFTQRGWIPYAIVGFSAWALMLLLVKLHKITIQRKALQHAVTPTDHPFVLSTATVDQVLEKVLELADQPDRFVLFNRIHFALQNFRNFGRVGDVGDVLRARAEMDEAVMESSYTVLRGLIWAIPILGFIGTVLGLSAAIGSFSDVLDQSESIAELRPALQNVTAGLATAFETTLQGLVAVIVIFMLMTFVRRFEEQTMDAFTDYCDHHILNKLRLNEGQPTTDS